MRLSLILSAVTDRIDHATTNVSPPLALLAAATSAAGNIAVWQGELRDWAALAAVVLSVPTAACVLIYWLFKVRREWLDRNK